MSIIFNSADIADTMNNGVSNVTGADSTITENYSNVIQHGIKIDMSVSEKTISGTPPLSFNSNGTPLIDYTIYGNTIESQSCGVKTSNLFDGNYATGYVTADGKYRYPDNTTKSIIVECEPNTTYTIKQTTYAAQHKWRIAVFDRIPTNNTQGTLLVSDDNLSESTITTLSDSAYIVVYYVYSASLPDVNFMINIGSSALPYEPYGYKIPVSVGGQTYNIFIGSDPLRKAIDGTNAVDTINYGTQQLIRRVDINGTALSEPVTETIEVPRIETIDGINVIDIQTTLKPSNISITYKGR